jgi:K+-transporting ATPase c subunit
MNLEYAIGLALSALLLVMVRTGLLVAIRATLVTLVTGLIYPLVTTGVALMLFPGRAQLLGA